VLLDIADVTNEGLNMNLVTKLRREHLLKHIDLSGIGLEIGPYDQPTVFKSESDIRYLDWKKREQLVQECAHPELVRDIPEIDYVVKSNSYREYICDRFNYIIANHVMEHAPNMIQWLAELCAMLEPGGVLFLALPDKRFSFDKYRQDTALSHFVAEYLAVVEEIPREHQIECEIYYDEAFINKPMNVRDKLDMTRIRRKLEAPPHVGIHSHVFDSHTIVSKVLKPILMMGFVELNLVDFVAARAETGGEMIIIMRREAPSVDLTTQEFYTTPIYANPEIADMELALETARAELHATRDKLVQMDSEIAAARSGLFAARGEIAKKDATIAEILSSSSWRITAPLREVITTIRKIAGRRNASGQFSLKSANDNGDAESSQPQTTFTDMT
jgi:hypothetical protein